MASEDVMAVDERLARLEQTVAKGFSELSAKLEQQGAQLNQRGAQLDRLQQTVAKGFSEHGGRLDRLEQTVEKEFSQHGGRLDRLEQTVEKGFSQHGGRLDRLDDRMTALESKLDVAAESIRGDIKTVLEGVTGLTAEVPRTSEAMRKEHEADRRVTRAILLDHVVRIRALEGAIRPASDL